MIYFDPIIIDAMARGRLSCTGQLINLDMRDYHMFVSDREAICAVRVRSESSFSDFLTDLRVELHNAKSAIDEPAEVMIHLLAHPEADVTMKNYEALCTLIREIFGDKILIKFGYGTDTSSPNNHKDIMLFIAGNQP